MSYILVSYFNSNNLGDVLLSNILYKKIKEKTSVVTCSFEGDFVIPEDKLYKDKWLKRVVNKFFAGKKDSIFWKKFEEMLADSEGLIIGGGNMLMDIETYSTIDLFKRYISLAKKYDKRIIVPFVGIGPIQSPTLLDDVNICLNQCSYISVRDKKALAYITKKDVYCTFDPAFLLESKTMKKDDKIIINVINPEVFSTFQYDNILRFYLKLIESVLATFSEYKIILLVTEYRDKGFANHIMKRLIDRSNVVVCFPKTTEAFVNEVSKAKFVVAARMHLMIVSYTQDIPFLGLNWQNKIQGFFDNIEMSEKCLEFSESEITEIIESIKNSNLNDFKCKISKRKKHIQDDIILNLNVIGDLINET